MARKIFHRDGLPVGEFRKSWQTACIAAGLGSMICSRCEGEGSGKRCPRCKITRKYRGRIFHDFRRSGVRNLIRAGVPQNVATRISGHRTDSTFRRHDILQRRGSSASDAFLGAVSQSGTAEGRFDCWRAVKLIQRPAPLAASDTVLRRRCCRRDKGDSHCCNRVLARPWGRRRSWRNTPRRAPAQGALFHTKMVYGTRSHQS
jgi:hypothetical protein